MDNDAVSYRASDAVEYSGRHPSQFLQANLSAHSTPKGRHARLFSKNVPKIVARDRIYQGRDFFIRTQRIAAFCFAHIFGNVFTQFQQARIVANWRGRLKRFAGACGFSS